MLCQFCIGSLDHTHTIGRQLPFGEAAAFSRNRIKKNTQKQTYGENQKGRTVITIFFDLDDTLYDQIEPFRKAYDAVFGNRFDIDIYQLFEARSVRGDEVFELAQCGKMPMDEMHIYRIQKAFEDLGYVVTDEEALRYQKLYEENQGKISMSDTVKKMLELCNVYNIRVGIISNGPSGHQRKKAKVLNVGAWIPEEHIVISGDYGVSKPNTGLFLHAQRQLGTEAKDCILVGDNYQNDIVGAKRAGWKAVWLNKRGQDIREEVCQPDYEVKNEAELFAWVRSVCERGMEL
ncbi:HAD family hydrolase [bacterium 1XD42-54]|jgi:putative hydrolase of the HAD superfamily|nr:HAD family hydrolase [bacterium 1XD42-54]